jgi:hypothetical protein
MVGLRLMVSYFPDLADSAQTLLVAPAALVCMRVSVAICSCSGCTMPHSHAAQGERKLHSNQNFELCSLV